MNIQDVVYAVNSSVENDRPMIEFDSLVNQGIDWRRLDAILQGERPTSDYQELDIVIPNSRATSWGYFSVPGTLGLISADVIRYIDYSAMALYDLLSANINGSKYFFLRPSQTLPCLDLARSEIVTFRSNPSRIKDVKKYAFIKSIIPKYVMFSIPDLPGLFATSGVYQAIVNSRMPGFRFTPLD